ncbi:MAG: FMN-binding protein, partial [Clostridia bacterium]|nr:FMN-binding protein [Clostridia bacterium]
DLLTDDSRKALAEQIVEKQDVVDAISGVTISSDAVKEAVAEILGQQGAPAESVEGETVTVEKETAFSTITVEAVVADGKIVDAKITSEGANDLLTDDSRKALAEQIVEKQDVVDAISGVTISSDAVKEAVAEILGQQGAPAESVEGETVTVEKETAFSTITVEAVVADGKIVDAKITSEGENDLLNDDMRAELAAQIVEKQDVVDAISGVTVSTKTIKEAVAEILGQQGALAEEAPAEAAEGETVTVEKETPFSTIKVEATVEDGKIVDAKITSEGENDLLNDDMRAELAAQIVEKQDVVDAITGVTVSTKAIREAVAEILGH